MATNPTTKEAKEGRNASSSKNEEQKYVSRPVEVTCLRFQIHHGGMFVYYPAKVYVQGEMIEMNWDWDVDHMSYIDIVKLVKSIGYLSFCCLWYKVPKLALARGLEPLQNDQDVLEMIESAKGYKVIELYVDHLIDTPIERKEVSDLDSEEDEDYVASKVEDLDDSEEDEDYVASEGEEHVASEVDDFTDSDYDEKWDWTSVLPIEIVSEVRDKVKSHGVSRDNAFSEEAFADFVGEDYDSEQLDTPPNSEDDEDEPPKFPHFKMPNMGEPIKLELGMKFSNKQQITLAVKEYAMSRKKNVWLKYNDTKRMVVKCIKGCPFHLRWSKRFGNNYWQIVSFNDEHCCYRTARNRQAKTEWLAKKFVSILRHTPEMKSKGLRAEALKNWGVKLSHAQAYRAKRRAIEMIQGAGAEQYNHLRYIIFLFSNKLFAKFCFSFFIYVCVCKIQELRRGIKEVKS